MSVKVFPPSVLTSHWTVGAGLPTAAAVRDTCPPESATWLVGFVVTTGAVATVSVAAAVVAVPFELVNTARYWFPFLGRGPW